MTASHSGNDNGLVAQPPPPTKMMKTTTNRLVYHCFRHWMEFGHMAQANIASWSSVHFSYLIGYAALYCICLDNLVIHERRLRMA